MEKPKRSDNKYWKGTHDFNDVEYEMDLEEYITELENQNSSRFDALVKPVACGQWVNVVDKLPEIDEPVLIYDGDGIAVSRMDKDKNWWINESYGWNEDGLIPQVYYWMPLPSKPSA